MQTATTDSEIVDFGRLGGHLSWARRDGDAARVEVLERQLAVARCRRAIQRELAGVTLTDDDRAALVAAIG